MGKVRAGLLLAAIAVAMTGCFSPPPEALARLEATRAAEKEMQASLDMVEERLLGNQATLKLWAEMKDRHQHVSELACKNHSAHFDAMVAHLEKNQERARGLKRRRVAQVKAGGDTVLSSAAPSRSNKARN